MPVHVTDLLIEAAYLMAVGMCVVFIFLGCLIGAMNLIAWLVKQVPEPPLPMLNVPRQTTSNEPQLSASLVAAITAAVHQHRNQ